MPNIMKDILLETKPQINSNRAGDFNSPLSPTQVIQTNGKLRKSGVKPNGPNRHLQNLLPNTMKMCVFLSIPWKILYIKINIKTQKQVLRNTGK